MNLPNDAKRLRLFRTASVCIAFLSLLLTPSAIAQIGEFLRAIAIAIECRTRVLHSDTRYQDLVRQIGLPLSTASL
jgi:hypothetical protein